MASTKSDALTRLREADYRKLLRFGAVSAIAFPATQVILLIFTLGLDWPPATANIAAVSIAAVPAYVLNRYWVWGKKDKNRLTTEILPFWGITLLGLVISTVFAHVGSDMSDSPLVANVANTLGFGSVWVLKFFVIDRLMFGQHHHIEHQHFPPDEDLDAEIHAAEASA